MKDSEVRKKGCPEMDRLSREGGDGRNSKAKVMHGHNVTKVSQGA
jgi:hypothetical protein